MGGLEEIGGGVGGKDDLEEVDYLANPLKGQKIWANSKVEIHIKGEETSFGGVWDTSERA